MPLCQVLCNTHEINVHHSRNIYLEKIYPHALDSGNNRDDSHMVSVLKRSMGIHLQMENYTKGRQKFDKTYIKGRFCLLI